MKKQIFVWAVMAALAAPAACTRESPLVEAPAEDPGETASLLADAYERGIALVLFDEEMAAAVEAAVADGTLATKSAPLDAGLSALGVTSMRRLFPDAGRFEARTRRAGLHRWYVLTYDDTAPVTKAASSLQDLPGVETVEGRRRVRQSAVFDDPRFPLQWGYANDGAGGGTPRADINVSQVWSQYTTGHPDVIVAVIDGGVDLTHEDLRANCIPAGYAGSYNYVDRSATIYAHDHGTHVAGTIAAVNNNGTGVAGIAGGDYAAGVPGARILSHQVFKTVTTAEGTYDTIGDFETAIKEAADHGAVIANNSWGDVIDLDEDGRISADELVRARALHNEGPSAAMRAAIDYFITNAGYDENGEQTGPMAGGVIFFAAGNDNIPYNAYGAYDPVLSVAAFDRTGAKSSFSNYGSWVDIAAPGSDIWSTVPGNAYDSYNGTSMACPHAAGVAALIVSQFGGPGFTADMLREKLLGGADAGFIPASYGIGPKIDAFGAFAYGSTDIPDAVAALSAEASSNNVDFTFSLTSVGDGIPSYGYLLMAAQDRSALEAVNPAAPGKAVTSALVSPAGEVGDEVTVRLSGLDFSTDYYVAVAACSANRIFSDLSPIVAVSTGANNPPVIACDQTGTLTVMAYRTVSIPIRIYDPDGHAVTVECTPGSDAFVLEGPVSGGDTYTAVITGTGAAAGSYRALIKASDPYGRSDTFILRYTLRANRAPQQVAEVSDLFLTRVGEACELDMTQYVTDPDGEVLRYEVSYGDASVIYFNAVGNRLYGTSLRYGATVVTVKASDFMGESVTFSFRVLIRQEGETAQVSYNAATGYLTVGTGTEEMSTRIRVAASTGATVYDVTVTCSAYHPCVLNMGRCAPGIYRVLIEYGGQRVEKTIVKK